MGKLLYCPTCMEKIKEGTSICPMCRRSVSVQNEAHQLKAGIILAGRYLVGTVLGEGGFGITYIGRDIKLDMKVAIKEYYPVSFAYRHSSQSLSISVSQTKLAQTFEHGKEKVLDEARKLAMFSDEPNIVPVRDFFVANNTAYIVMAFLEGENLQQYLDVHGPMPFDTALEMLKPVMAALEKVHAQGLVHRDISPSNLMLLNTGKVVLIDCGAARGV
ncbi:MAG: protein kinase, partial [Bacteroides thetaiotaomicron]|nr:protein kinase [Bacteroides thetaiotaomicron]